MAIGPREVVRSEVEGGLSGPANPIPNESLDCGCRQFPLPKLAKFATRRLFVGLLCWVGIVQAAAHAYLYIISPTIARRFQFDPNLIEWILIIAETTPFVLGLLVAYWGDRIHRAAWTGTLTLLQSAGFFLLIIPHFIHDTRIIEEPENVTHMSIYGEDNPELCSSGLARFAVEKDESCYTTLVLLVGVQILTGMANVAYYTLGISYLDDNTRKRHVAAIIGIVIAVKVMGLIVGYILAWGCLKLDSETLKIVVSYREQIGAWWLGWPLLAIFLLIPGTLISWLPRRLPSEVVEQAAASILDLAGRMSPNTIETPEARKVGGTGFFASLLRLLSNKILACNVLVAIFCMTAVINFVANENIFLESRYHVPRPTGMLLGFGDPMSSRIVVSTLKPIIIGMVIIISGMVIAKSKPRATSLTIYHIVVFVVAATIIFSLVYATCDKPPIAGERRGSIGMLKYCNKNCCCSMDADFRPICDRKSKLTFYSPCHAGCMTMDNIDGVTYYNDCSRIEEMTGLGNTEATEGPCGSSTCQIGWLLFGIATLIVYSLVASSIVGTLLIVLRSVYVQDKALAIGFWMTFVSLFVYVPGKLAYNKIADMTCKHWGTSSICHLHDGDKLGSYLCYLTAFLLILAAAFEILLWFFCRKLNLYGNLPSESLREVEMQGLERNQGVPLLTENSAATSNVTEPENKSDSQQVVVIETSVLDLREQQVDEDSSQQSQQLKYGPVGPGDRRTNGTFTDSQDLKANRDKMRQEDTDDELDTSSDEEGTHDGRTKKKTVRSSPQVAYRPLELDSDVESDLSSIGPRSRRRVPSSVFDDLPRDYQVNVSSSNNKRPFPNPDHYENASRRSSIFGLSNSRNGKSVDNFESMSTQGGFSRTSSFEFAKKQATKNDTLKSNEGDFNEVGIPVMEPLVAASVLTTFPKPDAANHEVHILLPRHQKQASQERLDTIRSLLVSVDETRRHRLEKDSVKEVENEDYSDVPPPVIGRPPSRGQASSGFGSSTDVGERMELLTSLSSQVNKDTNQTSSTTATPTSPKNGSTKGSPLSTAL